MNINIFFHFYTYMVIIQILPSSQPQHHILLWLGKMTHSREDKWEIMSVYP